MALCGGVLLRDSLENPRESLISNKHRSIFLN